MGTRKFLVLLRHGNAYQPVDEGLLALWEMSPERPILYATISVRLQSGDTPRGGALMTPN